MTLKKRSYSKYESQPDAVRYRFYGYTFELPPGMELLGVMVDKKRYSVRTPDGVIPFRACHQCKRLLQLTHFYEGKSPCKQCHMVMVKRWDKRNPDRAKRHKAVCNKNYHYKQKLKSAGIE